jgi:hypothetical protein
VPIELAVVGAIHLAHAATSDELFNSKGPSRVPEFSTQTSSKRRGARV